jgi:hypothetical protein
MFGQTVEGARGAILLPTKAPRAFACLDPSPPLPAAPVPSTVKPGPTAPLRQKTVPLLPKAGPDP